MTVKGSKQEKFVVVSYDPWSSFWRRFLLFALVFVFAGATYVFGRYEASATQEQAIIERDQLIDELEELQQKATTYNQRVLMLEKGGEVDRRSTEGLRQGMVDLRTQIATLQEEVAFYKGIMAPSSRKYDLRIQKLELEKALEDRRFRYKVVVTQVGTNQNYISGLAVVNISGVLDGKQKVYGLRDISDDVKDYGIKFKFRYFQEISGQLLLPEGFTAESIEVVLQSKGLKGGRVEHSIVWPGKEQQHAKQ